jgi:predicted transcriptional regulator
VTDSIESDFIPASLALGSGPNVLLMCLDNNLANSNRAMKTNSPNKNGRGFDDGDDDSLFDHLAAALRGNSIASSEASAEIIQTGKGGRKNTGGVASTSTLGTGSISTQTTIVKGNQKSSIGQQNNSSQSMSSASSSLNTPTDQPPNGSNLPQNISASLLTAPPVIAIAPPTASTVSDSAGPLKTDKSPPRLRLPNGKLMSKADEKFHRLTKLMPGIKIDRRMRQTIIQSMKEINCWSDSDGEEDDLSSTKKGKKKVNKQSSLDLQEESTMTSATPKVTFAESVGIGSQRGNKLSINTSIAESESSSSSPYLLSPTKEGSPLRGSVIFRSQSSDEEEGKSPGSMTRTIEDLAQPTSIRQRVTLVKPKQIQDSQALLSLEERKRLERDAVRENLIQKAIHMLVELRKEQDETQHMNVVSLLKEQSSSKYVAVKRVVFGLVDRAVKRAKIIAKDQ